MIIAIYPNILRQIKHLIDSRTWSCAALCKGMLLVLALHYAPRLQAQDYDHYTPLQCMGPIPEELRTASSQKYAQDLAALGDSATGREGRARDNFLLQSNFVLDEMLLSGRVLFGDPVTAYVTRVKDHILREDPALQKEIRIYLVKSPVVNAFATNSGVLLINMGLMAHLKTEAELAFVLCHEIQHYIHKHPINNYVNAENLKSNARILGLNSADDYIAARTRYSRDLELDADEFGFDLYSKSGYSLAAAEGVFDLLDYADQPFDQIPWDGSMLEWEFMRFPTQFTLWPLDSIQFKEDIADSMSTHPNIAKRRSVIMERVAKAGEDKGDVFIVGVEDFLDARKRCRFELSELFLSNHEYEAAIYNSYLLQTEEPESHYLQKVIAQAVYGMCTYKNARRFGEAHVDSDEVAGEFQQLTYFMEMGNREMFTIMAVHETWKAYLANPEDGELKAVADAVLTQLMEKHRSTAEWLAHERPTSMPGRIDTLLQEKQLAIQQRGQPEAEEDEEDEEEEEKDNENDYLEWALTDLFEDDRFADAWAEALAEAKEIDDEEYQSANGMRAMTRKEKLKGIHLGIDKIVLMQPIYKSVDMREAIPVQYIASEEALEDYKKVLTEMADRNAVGHQFLENRNLAEGDVQVFNDVSTMLLWFSDHSNGSDEKINLVNFKQDEAQALVERYGTKYFVWNGVIQVTDRSSAGTKLSWLFVGCTVFPILPYAIYKMTRPENQTLFVTYVFDLERSQAIWEDYRVLKSKDKRPILRSVVYDQLYQIGSDK